MGRGADNSTTSPLDVLYFCDGRGKKEELSISALKVGVMTVIDIVQKSPFKNQQKKGQTIFDSKEMFSPANIVLVAKCNDGGDDGNDDSDRDNGDDLMVMVIIMTVMIKI